jgi:hypothetical protein
MVSAVAKVAAGPMTAAWVALDKARFELQPPTTAEQYERLGIVPFGATNGR